VPCCKSNAFAAPQVPGSHGLELSANLSSSKRCLENVPVAVLPFRGSHHRLRYPVAPEPQPAAQSNPPSGPQSFASTAQQVVIPPLRARRYAQVIEPGQATETFSPPDKIIFSLTEVARPITLIPSLYSSGWEQIFLTDPKYGSDAGAFAERFGAAMLRSTSVRVFSDGIFASAFHQDPRYYRVAHGSAFHRALFSARQALVRRSDSGDDEFNYSGVLGRAAAAALTTTYYPSPSVTGRVVGLTFATSMATDAGGNLVLEFLPSVIRKVPIMQKLRLE
jgi:hypothetical protein